MNDMRIRLAAAFATAAIASLALSASAPARPSPIDLACTLSYASHVTDPPPEEPHTPMPYDCDPL